MFLSRVSCVSPVFTDAGPMEEKSERKRYTREHVLP